MKISQKTIDEIFNTAVIEDVISEFVALKKAGATVVNDPTELGIALKSLL